MATAVASVGASKRHRHRPHAAWRKRRSLEKDNLPGHPNVASQWAVPSIESEVRALLTYMQRTRATAQEMYELIGVTDREYLELCQWAADKPTIAGALDSMMIYRDEILKRFKALIIEEKGSALC